MRKKNAHTKFREEWNRKGKKLTQTNSQGIIDFRLAKSEALWTVTWPAGWPRGPQIGSSCVVEGVGSPVRAKQKEREHVHTVHTRGQDVKIAENEERLFVENHSFLEEGTGCPIFPTLVVLQHWRTSLSPLGVSPSSSICLLLLSTFCFFSGLPQRHPPREGLITGTGSGKVSMHRCADVQQVRRCTSYVAAGKAACSGIGLPCLFR